MFPGSLEHTSSNSFPDSGRPLVDTSDSMQEQEIEENTSGHADDSVDTFPLYFDARDNFDEPTDIETMTFEPADTDQDQISIEVVADTDQDQISIEILDQEPADTDKEQISIEILDQEPADVAQDVRIDQYYTLLHDKVFLISNKDADALKEEIKTNLQESKLYGKLMEKLANIYAEKGNEDRSTTSKYLGDILVYKQMMRLKSAITGMHNRAESRLQHLQSQRENKGWSYYHIVRGLEVHKLKQETANLHKDIRLQANEIFHDNIQTIDRLAQKYGIDKERTFDAIQYSLHSSEYTAEMTNFFTTARKKNYAIDLVRALAGHSSKPDAAKPIVDSVINKQPDPFETKPTDYLNRGDLMPIISERNSSSSNSSKGKGREQDTRTYEANELDPQITRYYDFLTTKVFEIPDKAAASLREEIAQQLAATPLYEQRIERLMGLYEPGASGELRTKARLKEYLTKVHGRYEERLDHKKLERQERANTSEVKGDIYYNITNRFEVSWLKSETNSIHHSTRKEAGELFSQHEKVFDAYLNDIQAEGQNISKQAFFDALVFSLHSAQHKAHARVLFERSQPDSIEQIYEFARETLAVASQAMHAQWGTLAYDRWEGVFDAPRPW